MKTQGLDIECIWQDDEWQIWTPDTTGGVLGSGKTANEAMADAVANMEALCAEIRKELQSYDPPRDLSPEAAAVVEHVQDNDIDPKECNGD